MRPQCTGKVKASNNAFRHYCAAEATAQINSVSRASRAATKLGKGMARATRARVIRARRAGRYLWGITAEQRRGITRLLANAGIHDPTPPLKKKHPREFSAPPSALEMMTVEEVEAANAEDRAAIRRRMKEWGIDFVINPNLARDFDWLYGGQRYAD